MDVDAIVAAADAMEQWLRREDPDVCRLMFRSSVEELAEAAAPILLAAGRRHAADAIAAKLRLAAAGRRQYAATVPVKDELLLQAHTLDSAVLVAEGDDGPLYAWVPSWMWTDEMHDRVAEGAPAEPVEEADRG